LPAALGVLEKARADFPGTWGLIKLESEVLQAAQRNDEALALVQEFSRANWWHSSAALTLGRIYFDENRFAEAGAVLRHASRLDVHDTESLNLIALMDVRQNRLEDAFEIQTRAISRQPDQPRQYLLLADILEKMGRSDEARAALARVTRLQDAVRADSIAN